MPGRITKDRDCNESGNLEKGGNNALYPPFWKTLIRYLAFKF